NLNVIQRSPSRRRGNKTSGDSPVIGGIQRKEAPADYETVIVDDRLQLKLPPAPRRLIVNRQVQRAVVWRRVNLRFDVRYHEGDPIVVPAEGLWVRTGGKRHDGFGYSLGSLQDQAGLDLRPPQLKDRVGS